jgi:ATP-binding cassette subfamily B (MDR/TAP) protein 9
VALSALGVASVCLAATKAVWRWASPPGRAAAGSATHAALWWSLVAWTCVAGIVGVMAGVSALRERRRQIDEEDGELGAALLRADGGGDGAEGSPKGSRALAQLARLSAPDWVVLLGASFFLVVAAIANAAVPRFSGGVVDAVSFGYNRREFNAQLVFLSVAAVVNGVGSGCRGALFLLQMARLNRRVRERLVKALLSQELAFFDATPLGDISSRINNDTTKLTDALGLNINVLLRNLVSIVFLLGFMLHLEPRLTGLTFTCVPVATVVSKFYGEYYRKKTKQTQDSLAAAGTVADESLSALSTIRSFAAEELQHEAYRKKLGAFYAHRRAQASVYVFYQSAMTSLPQLCQALILLYGGHMVLAGKTAPGTLVSFLLYQQTLSASFSQLGDVYSQLSAAVGAAEKVLELMHREPAFDNREGELRPTKCLGTLDLRGVTFAYTGREPVLRNLTLRVEPNETVAFCGPSGGGKSSIIKLIERFYIPQAGQVLFDGNDIGSLDQAWYKRQVGLVGQEPVLLARSVRENILFGLEGEASEEELERRMVQAARRANAHDFISSLPEAYDTFVGQRGVCMSGGQKQRIAIARALVREPRLLLLDEATSALDAESEALVQEALDELMAGRTVLAIAHRLSTIQSASRILVIQDGGVAESGTHAELLARDGVYAQLARRQLGGGSRSASARRLTAGSDEGANFSPGI